MRTILFLFFLPFVSFCCMHLYFMFTAVSYQMFFHCCSFMYPHWGFWNKPLDLTCLGCDLCPQHTSCRTSPVRVNYETTQPRSGRNQNLKQEWLLAFWNKIQTHKRFKRTLIYYDTDTRSANFKITPKICRLCLCHNNYIIMQWKAGYSLRVLRKLWLLILDG